MVLLDEGPAFPSFSRRVMVLRNTLLEYWHEVHKKYGYVQISTPKFCLRSFGYKADTGAL
jgi:threonyl-tRNA synthetase